MLKSIVGLVVFISIAVGCSSIRPKPLDYHVNVGQKLASLDEEIKKDEASHASLLVPQELREANDKIARARRALYSAERRERLLERTGLAEAHVENVRRLIAERQPRVAEILHERDAAINAGALNFTGTHARLRALDDLFRERFPTSDSRRERLLNGYREVEVTAVSERVLWPAREQMAEARRLDAKRAAPAALATAEKALASAENAVRANPRRADHFRNHVNLAENLARALVSIAAQSRVVMGRTDEDVARELLVQRQRVDQLKAELDGVELNARLRERKLLDATEENRFLRAIEVARQDLGEDNASVYRDGDRLLIRLKKDPTAAGTLAKVKGVIRKVGGRDVLVQGGTPRRAEAVTQSLGEVTSVGRLVGPESEQVEVLVRPEIRRR